MTLADYVTTISFMVNGVQPWDEWVEDESGFTSFVRSRKQRDQMAAIG